MRGAFAPIWPWLLGGLLVCIGLGLLNLAPNMSAWDATYHNAHGYGRVCELLIRNQWLEYNPSNETVQLVADPAGADSVMVNYRDRSYLMDDLRAFNSGQDKTVFRIVNDRVVSIDHTRHRMLLPFSEPRMFWLGDLTYRPERRRQAELVGTGGRAVLTTPRVSLVNPSRDNELILRYNGTVISPIESPLDVVKFRTSSNEIVGKSFLLGDCLVVDNRSSNPANGVLLNGQKVLQGASLRLDPGDVIKFTWRDRFKRSALLYSRILPESPLISTVRMVNGRRRPVEVAESVSLGTSFRHDMTDILERGVRNPRGQQNLGVRLTLDRRMHETTQQILTRFAEGRRKAGSDKSFFRAAVTIMDAHTGEVLAMASYPDEETLKAHAFDPDRRAALVKNHNLSRRPIGSVAKVPFATAILAQHPELATLKIPTSGEEAFMSLLGIQMQPSLHEAHAQWGYGDDNWLDFDEFLVFSINRYAAILMTLATAGRTIDNSTSQGVVFDLRQRDPECEADSLGVKDRFQVAGRMYRHRPRIGFDLAPIGEKDTGTDLVRYEASVELETSPFVDRFESLFGIPVRYIRGAMHLDEGRPMGTDLQDPSPWRHLIEHLFPGDREIPHETLLRVSPERLNLSFNLATDFRLKFIPLILGNGFSRWTNLEVCQTFSRLITGNVVEPVLVYDLQQPSVPRETGAPESANIPDTARRKVLRAMENVIRAGTAKELRPYLDEVRKEWQLQGYAPGLFGKTGTPALVIQDALIRTRALDDLISQGVLWISQDDGMIHYRDSGAVTYDPGPDGAFERLKRNSTDMQTLDWVRPRVLDPNVIFQRMINSCAEFNRRPPEDRRSLFVVENGVLVRALGFSDRIDTGAAFACVFGRYSADATQSRYYIDALGNQPDRALAMSVIFEKPGQGSGAIMPLVNEILREVMEDALEIGW